MALQFNSGQGVRCAVIMVNFGNDEHGSIQHLRQLQSGFIQPFFRGHRAKLSRGDIILAHDMEMVWGYIEFYKYARYKGSNLQNMPTTKADALWLSGPFYEFQKAIRFAAGDQPGHYWNHIGAPLVSTPTFMALKAQCEIAVPISTT